MSQSPPDDLPVRGPLVESHAEEGYVLVRLPPSVQIDVLQRIFVRAVAKAGADGLTKVVIDVRGAEDSLTGWPGYVLADACQIFRDHHIACAICTDPDYRHRLQFVENVAFNRSVKLRIFAAMEDALDWLARGALD